MSEVFAQLGIDSRLLFAQVVNFFLIFWIIKRYLWPIMSKFLDERARKIEQGLKLQREFDQKVEQLEKDRKAVINKARTKADRLVAEAENEAQLQAKKIIYQAQDQKQKILQEARAQAEVIKAEALKGAQKDLERLLSMGIVRLVPELEDEEVVSKRVHSLVKELS